MSLKKAFIIRESAAADGFQGFSGGALPGAKQPQPMTSMDMPPVKLSFEQWATVVNVLEHHIEQEAQGKMVVDLEDIVDEIYNGLGQEKQPGAGLGGDEEMGV